MDLGNFILPFLYKGDGCGAPPRRLPLREISAQKSGICGADKNFYADDGLVHAVIVEYYVFSVNIRYQRAARFFIIKLTEVFYVIMNGPPVGQKPLFIITYAPHRGRAGRRKPAPRRNGTGTDASGARQAAWRRICIGRPWSFRIMQGSTAYLGGGGCDGAGNQFADC